MKEPTPELVAQLCHAIDRLLLTTQYIEDDVWSYASQDALSDHPDPGSPGAYTLAVDALRAAGYSRTWGIDAYRK